MLTNKKNSDETNTKASKSSPKTEKRSDGCCMGTTSCSTTSIQKPNAVLTTPFPATDAKKVQKTRIIVKYDVGFNNSIYIRGKGANLSWDKGVLLKNVKNDEWVWETDAPFATCEFKVLVNDKHYEQGENHHLHSGANISYTPKF